MIRPSLGHNVRGELVSSESGDRPVLPRTGPADTSNFIDLLRLLCTTHLPSTCITAAAQTVPFLGLDGYPITDVAPFAVVLDCVLFMNNDTK